MQQPNPNLNLPGVGGLSSRIICLRQAVKYEELIDDEDYELLVKDIREGVDRYAHLLKVVIPRPNPNQDHTPGVGKVFLEYADLDGASRARINIDGKFFAGNQVVAEFYPEDRYAQGDCDG